MAVHTAVDVLSRLLESYGSDGWEVRTVDASTPGADALSAAVELAVPLSAALDDERAVAAARSDDGRVAVEVALPEPPSPDALPGTVSVTEEAARLDDGDLLVDLAVDIDCAARDGGALPGSADGDAATAETGDGTVTETASEPADDAGPEPEAAHLAAARTESVPAYDDGPYLRALYEHCDTFAEMRDHIEMDVSAETVRRYMIDAGVHEPTSYESAGNGLEDADPPAAEGPAAVLGEDKLVTDGLGLPDDLEIGEVLDAVVESATVYEVECRLGLGQARTRELLRELDLLDLVLHRVTENPGECTYEEAAMRIRQTASGGASAP